jgi:hypothetical protein
MIVTTMNDIPGYDVEEVYGEVMGLTVRSRNIGSQLGAGLKSIFGGELKGMTKALVDSRHEGDGAHDGGGGGKGRQRDHRDALRHVGDGPELDGDLRVRDSGAHQEGLRLSRSSCSSAASCSATR